MMRSPHIAIVGSINMDLVLRTPRMPAVGETIQGQSFHAIAGGKGANQAVAIARQEIGATLIGCIGDDAFGQELHRNFIADGINTDYLFCQTGASTGVAGIFVDGDGHNSIVLAAGANQALSTTHIDSASTAISSAALLLCQLETPFDTVVHAITLAKQHGIPIVFNPAPMRSLDDQLLRQIDYLIINETEASQLSGVTVSSNETAMNAAKILHTRGSRIVLITLGAEGVVISQDYSQDADKKMVSHIKTPHAIGQPKPLVDAKQTAEISSVFIPAIKVKAIDTTAAGDTFVGVFAVGLVRGLTITEACIDAQYAAALTVTKLGAQTAIPSRHEVKNFKALMLRQ